MTGRGLLLYELEWITGNCCRLLELVKPADQEWRPHDNMRTLGELANHLAQIPAVDLRIIRGDGEEAIEQLERSLLRDKPRAWGGVMREGMRDLSRFMERLSLDDYENGSGTAFYGKTQTHAQWLLAVVTHIYHHRAQLFTYLKLKGYGLNGSVLWS